MYVVVNRFVKKSVHSGMVVNIWYLISVKSLDYAKLFYFSQIWYTLDHCYTFFIKNDIYFAFDFCIFFAWKNAVWFQDDFSNISNNVLLSAPPSFHFTWQVRKRERSSLGMCAPVLSSRLRIQISWNGSVVHCTRWRFTSFVLLAGHPGPGQIDPMRSHRRN